MLNMVKVQRYWSDAKKVQHVGSTDNQLIETNYRFTQNRELIDNL